MNQALEESIAHWQRLSTGTSSKDEYIGPHQCALCKKYLWSNGCEGCPVKNRTGLPSCESTPYDDVQEFDENFIPQDGPDNIVAQIKSHPEFKRLAKLELEFLISLRDNDKGNTPQ